jgi:hypothetical protein
MVGGSRVRNFQTCTACASSAPPFYTFPELQQAYHIIPIPSNNFTAPLTSTLLVEVSWLAACMASECGISRLVRLVHPAHHHFTLSPSSNRPNALFSCPVTTLLPPWLLHSLWKSHGGCLHGIRVRNFQTCTACASSAPPVYTFQELQQA